MQYAIPYRRFSSDKQAKGDSTRRQGNDFARFCERHGLAPWEEYAINDDGVSGWKGHNAREGTLADFLALVKSGKVPRGTVLVVENQDRLSRDQVNNTLQLFNQIVSSGVWIGDCFHDSIITESDLNDPLVIMRVVMNAVRAYDYSESLSRRLKSAWRGKRERATASKEIVSKGCPSWLVLRADRSGFDLVEDRVAIVRRIFALATEGKGAQTIANTLHQEGHLTPSGKRWQPSNLLKIIKGRAVLGEYQPNEHQGHKRAPSGEPIADYFPQVISHQVWDKANKLLSSRSIQRKGRQEKSEANLFRGLLYDARTSLPYHVAYSYGRNKTNIRRKLQSHYTPGETASPSIDYSQFEEAFLKNLEELDPQDFVETPLQDELVEATTALASIDAKIEQTETAMANDDGEATPYLGALKKLHTKRQQIKERLEGIEHRVRNPIAETVVELQQLLKDNPQAIRSRIRLIVDSIWALVSQDGTERVVSCQVFFSNGLVRHFWFSYRASKGQRQGTINYKSTQLAKSANPDLRYWRSQT